MAQSRNQRRTEGTERNNAWRSLSPQQQLDALDGRLGKGVGAYRQRTKLLHVLFITEHTSAVLDTPVASKAEGRRRDALKKAKAKK